jgi:hypothetical protein
MGIHPQWVAELLCRSGTVEDVLKKAAELGLHSRRRCRVTDIREASIAVLLIQDHLEAIIKTINDPRLDRDEMYKRIVEETAIAIELLGEIRKKIESGG